MKNVKNRPLVDRFIERYLPIRGAKRAKARLSTKIINSYTGADTGRRTLSGYTTAHNDANSDILDSLDMLRQRSRDLEQNNPIAKGILNTKLTNVIGSGLKYHSRINREVLNLSEDQADAWEGKAEQEWGLFWNGKNVDITRTSTGTALLRMAYHQMKMNGDSITLLPRVSVVNHPYRTRLQLIEADRLSNPHRTSDTETLAGGVETDKYGAPIRYHISDRHPGSLYGEDTWRPYNAFGRTTGLRNVIHLYDKRRPGQSRGVPDLHAIIEPLRLLDKYTEAELMAAVVSGMFTVFVETPSGEVDFDISSISEETGQKSSDKDHKMAPGSIVGLAKGEKVHDSNPGRPNAAFDPFFQSIVKQIGVGVEIPFEVLMKHFSSSYSASRAAMLDAWRYFITERAFVVDNYMRPIQEAWMYEAVSSGRLIAPGYFTDPLIRMAYLGSEFRGPAKGHLDDEKEASAAKIRMESKLTTLAEETAELTGGDWEKNHKQQVKERNKQLKDGLIVEETTDGNAK